ncbi:MAG: ScyD/ScyE family protein [Actinobacteria bacterium]|nr:ScyD/ScyE family protein [Actinomycetota bacterium]
MKRLIAPALLVVVACLAVAGTAGSGGAAFTVVMSGLDNPRGLAFGPEGALYVAEAGRGGDGPCIFLRGASMCYGPTGAVSRLSLGDQARVVTGLPSYAAGGATATGPADISFRGRGGLFVSLSLGLEDATRRAELGPGAGLMGHVVRVRDDGEVSSIGDLAAYEASDNPDGNLVDSSPYGLLAGSGGRIVTDAGGNSLIGINRGGSQRTIAVFPSRPGRSTDAVPTSVVQGPDGALYVGELTGVPFADGAARVYRVVPGQEPEVFLTGFKAIIDIAFGPDGSLYVLQYATGPTGLAPPGALVRVDPDGTRTTIASEGLIAPTSVVVGPESLYVSNRGSSAGSGEVVRIDIPSH